MSMVINTNVQAINAQRNLAVTNSKMGKALEKLSSGLRINRSADDAAGLAISEKLRAQVRGLAQGQRNAQDGVSMVQTAEGALSEVHSTLQRMRELTVQAGNTTLSNADRLAIGEELNTLRTEINNIASRTKFNGLSLLTGSLSTSQDNASTLKTGLALATVATAYVDRVDVSKLNAGTTYTFTKVDADTARLTNGTTGASVDVDVLDGTIGADGLLTINFGGPNQASIQVVGAAGKTVSDVLTDLNTKTIITAAGSGGASYQVGSESADTISVSFDDMQAAALGSGGALDIGDLVTSNTAVDTVTKANTLLGAIDDAIQDVSTQRAKLGAAQNQIESAINSLGVAQENLSASESRIRDADIAKISSELVARQIMQQAGISVLSQANTSAQAALSLLQR